MQRWRRWASSMRAALITALSLWWVKPSLAVTRVALGYGLQANSMLNHLLLENMNKQILNSGALSLLGQSAGTNYRSTWAAALADEAVPYILVSLPEIRMSSDWQWGANTWGVFTSLSGMVPQTTLYYAGGYQLNESRTCPGIDYANCPLAALNFVSASGIGVYDIEVRTATRFYSFSGGMSWTRPVGLAAGGKFSLATEFGLNLQSLTAYSQFAAVRCANGSSAPCAQASQVRVIQGEQNAQALLAVGPYLGAVLRYERPQSQWFAELGVSAIFQFSRLQTAGYTNFVAGGTIAFTQTSTALGIDAVQDFFAVLPALSVRAGVRL
jgi:hypothetical protein